MNGAQILCFAALSALLIPFRSIAYAREPELRGALVFQKADKIVKLDLESRKAVSVGDGKDAYMAENGEIVFVESNPFIGGLGGRNSLVIVSADHSRRDVLVQSGPSLSNPVLSPDGSIVAYQDSCQTQRSLCALVVDRSSGRLVAEYPSRWPKHFTSNNLLVMTGIQSRNTEGIWLGGSDLDSLTRVNVGTFGMVYNPRVSPDGSRVAFEWSNHVWLARIDGTQRVQLTSSCDEEHFPTWSPDGRYLLVKFARACEGVAGGIYVISASDGSKLSRLEYADGQMVVTLSPMTWR